MIENREEQKQPLIRPPQANRERRRHRRNRRRGPRVQNQRPLIAAPVNRVNANGQNRLANGNREVPPPIVIRVRPENNRQGPEKEIIIKHPLDINYVKGWQVPLIITGI